MADGSKIEWTDATWNPVRGCSMAKGSELGGCLNCYAARYAVRGLQRDSSGKPFAIMRDSGPRWTGKVELVESTINRPLFWRKPRRIFVNSQSDLFHESLSFEEIDRVFTVMVAADWHTYQILTKRPERMLAYFGSGRHDGGYGPDRLDYHMEQNIWLGVSVEDFPTWDARVHLLKSAPAEKRFVSYEPALADLGYVDMGGLDWVIVGGESGPGARPFDVQWARNTIDQCKEAGVACFVKQLGAFYGSTLNNDKKGGDWSLWPEYLRVREFPA